MAGAYSGFTRVTSWPLLLYFLQGVLGEEQNGFRVDRRAEDNMFVVNELIERKKKEDRKLYVCFLDIEKAYDSQQK